MFMNFTAIVVKCDRYGCYIEEGRLGKFWQRLTEMLHRDEYSGCFIPSFVLKVLCIIQDMKLKNI